MPVPSTEDMSLISKMDAGATEGTLKGVATLIAAKYPRDFRVATLLAIALSSSGEKLSWKHEYVADVASTGGPSSLSTLICPLFLRAAGAVVPKLGVPGRPAGGIDCLAQLPGFETKLTVDRVKTIITKQGGYAHFLAEGQFAPLDGKMFAVRQASGTQEIPTLVAASLLSKKISVDVRYAGLDIRVAAHGNFGKDWNAASQNAQLFLRAAKELSLNASPVLTDARFPYQPYIGRQEALAALYKVFSGQDCEWLAQHLRLCRELAAACLPPELRPAVARVSREDLFKHFKSNILDQGVDSGAFQKIVEETLSKHTGVVRANSAGFTNYSLQGIRDVLISFQKEDRSSEFPDPVGLILTKRPGEWVDRGHVIATVRAPESLINRALMQLAGALGQTTATPIGPSMEGVGA